MGAPARCRRRCSTTQPATSPPRPACSHSPRCSGATHPGWHSSRSRRPPAGSKVRVRRSPETPRRADVDAYRVVPARGGGSGGGRRSSWSISSTCDPGWSFTTDLGADAAGVRGQPAFPEALTPDRPCDAAPIGPVSTLVGMSEIWRLAARRSKEFDATAVAYDEYRPRYPEELFDDIIELGELRPGARALEIGAGTGIATASLVSHGLQVVAIEPSSSMMELGQEKLGDTARFVAGRFEDWPLTEGVDLIAAFSSWHWVEPATGPRPRCRSCSRPADRWPLRGRRSCRGARATSRIASPMSRVRHGPRASST